MQSARVVKAMSFSWFSLPEEPEDLESSNNTWSEVIEQQPVYSLVRSAESGDIFVLLPTDPKNKIYHVAVCFRTGSILRPDALLLTPWARSTRSRSSRACPRITCAFS